MLYHVDCTALMYIVSRDSTPYKQKFEEVNTRAIELRCG